MLTIIDPNKIENIPQFLNKVISENENEQYIMFIFNDLYEHVINKQEFYEKYCDLLQTYDIPYAFYPYYLHFNKVLQNFISFPTPKMTCGLNGLDVFDIVNQTAYGMLIIDTAKLKNINFTFNELYKKAFYVQELIETCYQKNLYFSNSWYMDVNKSYKMVDSNMKEGFIIPVKDFTEEKTKFFSAFKQEQPESGNEFIKKVQEIFFSKKGKELVVNNIKKSIDDTTITIDTLSGEK